MKLTIGKYNAGVYCGSKIYRPSDWKLYGLFRKISTGFSIGPVLFWRSA